MKLTETESKLAKMLHIDPCDDRCEEMIKRIEYPNWPSEPHSFCPETYIWHLYDVWPDLSLETKLALWISACEKAEDGSSTHMLGMYG